MVNITLDVEIIMPELNKLVLEDGSDASFIGSSRVGIGQFDGREKTVDTHKQKNGWTNHQAT